MRCLIRGYIFINKNGKMIYMGIGIIVCGLNGSGKSTLGKALAEKLEIHFIDIENLFFNRQLPIIAVVYHVLIKR